MTSVVMTQLMGTCGVGLVSSFGGYNANHNETTDVFVGGIGLHCAGYVSERNSKNVYEAYHKKYKIVYQSPKRRNSNSGRSFIFVVYDRKVRATADMNKDFKFPFRPRVY